jgi:DNA processing protein
MLRHETPELRALLELTGIKGLGPGRIRTLISTFGSAGAVRKAGVQRLLSVPGVDREIARRMKETPVGEFADRQIHLMEKFDVGMMPFWDSRYPGSLKKIYDPPVLLFYRGKKEILGEKCFAVVGTRTPSTYGRNATEKLTRALVLQGFHIASGLASGVDTVAHQTALKNGGKTVAVLGSGLDWIYPAANRRLAKEIPVSGLLLSEYPMGTHPDPANFPRRNRIVSGLSVGVLVTEAGTGSGALITAYQALDQNREVFAVPGSIFSELSSGVHKLIQEGAKLVGSIGDILSEIDSGFDASAARRDPPAALAGLEQEIYELLSEDPMHIDAIVHKGNHTAAESLATLLALEIKGCVRQLAGKMFIRI